MSSSVQSLPITPWNMFWVFSRVGLSGFGGVLPFVRRALVERYHWLSDEELAELLSVGQLLPGPNVVNLAVMFGYRRAGLAGSVASALGLLFLPLCVLLCVATVYRETAHIPAVQGAVHGMLAASSGLIIALAIRMAKTLPRRMVTYLALAIVFIAVAILKWPMLWVIGGLLPILLAWGFWRVRASRIK
jgi:chromate transporter